MTYSLSSRTIAVSLLTITAIVGMYDSADAAYPYCDPRQNCFRDSDCNQGFCKNRDCQCYPDPGYCANRCLELGYQYADPNACGPGIPGNTVHITPCRGGGARPRYGGGIISYCNQCVPPPPPPTPVPPPTPASAPPCSPGYECTFTSASCTLATGTAKDKDGFPVTVRVYDGGTFLNQGPANSAFSIGYVIPTPPGPLKAMHTIRAVAQDVAPSGGVAGLGQEIVPAIVTYCLPPPPTVVLNATSPVAYLGTSTLSWNVPTASSCTGVGGPPGWAVAHPPTGNFVTGPLTADTTFSMYCTNDGGQGPTSNVFVDVQDPLAPVITSLSQPDYCATSNLSATVSWSSQTNNDFQVQVATNATFTAIVYDSKVPIAQGPQRWWMQILRWLGFADEAEAAGGVHVIPSAALAYDTQYYVRVRVRDNVAAPWSAWSANDLTLPEPITSFTTPQTAYPVPAFSWEPVEVFAGITVQFKDESTGNPTTWNWNFGDGTASTSQNPSHIYDEEGAYTVILQVTNDAGSCTSNPSQGLINVGKPIPGYREVRPGTQPSPTKLPLPGGQ